MLTRATFTNFKALKDVAVDLTPFTVIVGKNGSGKTSVLQGIHDLLRVPYQSVTSFSGASDPRRLVTRPLSGSMRIALTDEDERTFAIETGAEDGNTPRELKVSLTPGKASTSTLPAPVSGEVMLRTVNRADTIVRGNQLLEAAERIFGPAVFLRLNAGAMSQESPAATDEPKLEPDGQGLATVLNWMAGAMPEILDEVRRDLMAVVPQVRGIRTFPARVKRTQRERVTIGDQAVYRTFEEEIAGYRFALDMGPGRLIEADLLSEGTVLALGLLTALRHPQCPRLVLLDDVDAALHSSAQAELVRAIRAILAARPELQIICTSHSPDLLDNVSFEEIRVMALDRDGYARCGRLSEHPESEKWRKMLRTGEFWASVGEDWLLTGPDDAR